MPEYEGVVAVLKENNTAEVIIRPASPGITGAPEVSGKVCHCATDGSSVTIEAENMAQAEVGDRVLVRQETSALLKNAGLLIGLPMAGLAAGTGIGLMVTHGFSVSIIPGIMAIFIGVLLGVASGLTFFRRSRPGRSRPVLERVIRSGAEQATMAVDRTQGQNNDNVAGCGMCPLSRP